jgi:hypothetical protein
VEPYRLKYLDGPKRTMIELKSLDVVASDCNHIITLIAKTFVKNCFVQNFEKWSIGK